MSNCLQCFICLYVVCVSVHHPSTHTPPSTLPSCGPYRASLSPSNLPGACGWLLPFRQCPLISPGWREVTFMSYVYSRAPSSLLCRCCWLKHSGEAPLSKSIGSDSRSLSHRQHWLFEQERLERVESSWMITECAVTRGSSDDPVRRKWLWEQKTEKRHRGYEMFWSGGSE